MTCYPEHDEKIEIDPNQTERTYNLRGYAYAGGGRRVNRVEYSLDGGYLWNLANVNYPEDLFRKNLSKPPVSSDDDDVDDDPTWGTWDVCERETCFCWCFWNVEVKLMSLSTSKVIIVRAMDSSLASQPRDMYWNPTGMMKLSSNFRLSSSFLFHSLLSSFPIVLSSCLLLFFLKKKNKQKREKTSFLVSKTDGSFFVFFV